MITFNCFSKCSTAIYLEIVGKFDNGRVQNQNVEIGLKATATPLQILFIKMAPMSNSTPYEKINYLYKIFND